MDRERLALIADRDALRLEYDAVMAELRKMQTELHTLCHVLAVKDEIQAELQRVLSASSCR